MRFTQQTQNAAINLIRGYGEGELRISERKFRTALIVNAGVLLEEAALTSVEQLGNEYVERVMSLKPDVVLLGTGARQVFPAPAFGARFLRAGIGFEVMDTGAACRTYNVLVSEQRNVAAILLP